MLPHASSNCSWVKFLARPAGALRRRGAGCGSGARSPILAGRYAGDARRRSSRHLFVPHDRARTVTVIPGRCVDAAVSAAPCAIAPWPAAHRTANQPHRMWNAHLILNVIVPILSVRSDGAIPIFPQETASSAMMWPPNFHRTTRAGRLRWRIARRERLCAALIHGYRPCSSRSRRAAAEVGSNITIIINGVLQPKL